MQKCLHMSTLPYHIHACIQVLTGDCEILSSSSVKCIMQPEGVVFTLNIDKENDFLTMENSLYPQCISRAIKVSSDVNSPNGDSSSASATSITSLTSIMIVTVMMLVSPMAVYYL